MAEQSTNDTLEGDSSSGSSSEDDDASYSDDSSSLGSDIDDEADRLWDAMHVPAPRTAHPPTPLKTPEEILQEAITNIHDSKTTAIKIDDDLVQFLVEMDDNERPPGVDKVFRDLLAAITSSKEVKHVILGTQLLKLLTGDQHAQLYQLLIEKHSSTVTYWKLGSNDATELCGIPTKALLEDMASVSWPMMTEFQIRGLELSDTGEIALLVKLLLCTAPTIKLFNLLSIVLSPKMQETPGLFDAIWKAVESISQLDEVQLNQNTLLAEASLMAPPLISHASLEHLLAVKPKWWRMALDGMGLDDRHLEIIGEALRRSKDCKMNDLLSIRGNPKITSKGLSQLYNVCVNKQRMGLVHSDDESWVATFDLVRPLNNLHRRLEYKDEEGRFNGAQKWFDWFQVLSNLPWIDEKRKLNYIWFTLMEQPEMIPSAVTSCST